MRTVLYGILTLIYFCFAVVGAWLIFEQFGAAIVATVVFIVVWIFITWGLVASEQAGHDIAQHRGRTLGMWMGCAIGLVLPLSLALILFLHR